MKRAPMIVVALASLLLGAWIGLARAGWDVPLGRTSVLAHGPLLINGFLGTLIALERAVALDERWPFAAPILFVASAIALLFGGPAAVIATLASALFLAASVRVLFKQLALFTVLLAVGAACLFGANLLWALGRSVPELVLAWAAFLILTIAAERLELGRVLRPSKGSVRVFAGIASTIMIAGFATPFTELGPRAFGAALVAAAVWLVRNDVARRTIRLRGLPRYAAAAMLAGYAWLAIGGSALVVLGLHGRPLAYDATLHALFLGFVMTMIFGHAPIVLPAVTGVSLPYRSIAWVPLVLLHASVALRVISDLATWAEGRRIGVLFNLIAVVAFLATMAGSAIAARLATVGARTSTLRRSEG